MSIRDVVAVSQSTNTPMSNVIDAEENVVEVDAIHENGDVISILVFHRVLVPRRDAW